MRARAFILEPTINDASKASAHGDIVYLFARREDHPPVFSPGFTTITLRRLQEYRFDPTRDYVVITGALAANCILAAIVVQEFGPFNGLCFDARPDKQEYEVVTMGLDLERTIR